MTQTQDEPSGQATSAPRPEPASPAQPMIRVSPAELEQMNRLMRAPAPQTPSLTIEASRQSQVVDAAKPLADCSSGEFCAEDIVPPRDMRVSESVDIGGAKGTFTLTPNKAKIIIAY